MNDKQVQLIADEILQYLVDNPNAQDTVRGISEWWLLAKYTTADVEEVLEMLVHKRLVIEDERSDPPTYRMNQRRIRRIISRLKRRS
jgi:hypothetical protein